MNGPVSQIGEPSRAFRGTVGSTDQVGRFPSTNYLIDDRLYSSEGNWAFCVFESEEFLTARFGFQKGGFNITDTEAQPDRNLLQLHLELVSDQGAALWVPTGEFSVDDLSVTSDRLEIELRSEDDEIFSIRGWPDTAWHFRSENRELEIDIQFTVSEVTVLPDCILPFSVFAMWETVSDLTGAVRYGNRRAEVRGKVFHDHPRIIETRADVPLRTSYLYTAVAFEDGSSWYSYHAADREGRRIPYYCFGDLIDPDGRHDFSVETELLNITLDQNGLPESWKISWSGETGYMTMDVSVRPFSILKSWGKAAPKTANEFWIYPYVLDCTARIESGGGTRTVRGRGIPEYVDLKRLLG